MEAYASKVTRIRQDNAFKLFMGLQRVEDNAFRRQQVVSGEGRLSRRKIKD